MMAVYVALRVITIRLAPGQAGEVGTAVATTVDLLCYPICMRNC